jgi:hypothetical protein
MMIWRLYPIAIFVGLAMGAAVQLALVLLGVVALGIAGADVPADPPANFLQSPGVQAVLLASSFLGFVVAGYTAARYSPGEEIINACATGLVAVLIGLSSYQSPPLNLALGWTELALACSAAPLAAAGGIFFRRRALVA